MEENDHDPRLEFGLNRPTYIQQIKKILDQYPDDGQVLKELIQNAEDAGAKEVKFLYDHHSYGTEHLHHPGLAKFQGPALYAYNDAKFSPDDWKGIGMLCESIKEKDPTKVGRFGLGFKSVFHMTDLPTMMSGEFLGILDPYEKFFTEDSYYGKTGRKWYISRLSEGHMSDQFAPYKGVFGCEDESFNQGSYEGTLFRLHLRQEPSELSETIYSARKIQSLFKCFEKDAHLILLFLMNIEKIELYERTEQCSQPRKLFHVGISNCCLDEVSNARKKFKTKKQSNFSVLSGVGDNDFSFPEVSVAYSIAIETVRYEYPDEYPKEIKSEHSFVVTLFFSGSDVSQEIKALMIDKSLNYLPVVGVALPLNQPVKKENESSEEDVNMIDDHDDDNFANADDHEYEVMESSRNDPEDIRDQDTYVDSKPKGHLFCFLPLPLENKSLTGLPVHINGFFALSQNRRHLKWPSADQDETIQPLTDKSLLWNKGLLNEVLPKAYAELILHVTCLSEEPQVMITTSDVYTSWPDINKVDEKWKGILQPLFELLLKSKVLHSDANGGVWCKVEDILLENLEGHDQSRKIVIDVLNRAGRKVVTVPVNVKSALHQHYPTIEYVTPRVLRNSLKGNPSCYVHLNHKDKTLLLKYVLSDSDYYEDLEGLELLPLSDKTFTTFRRGSDPIYIDSTEHPKSLLPRLQRMFLDTEMDDITNQFKSEVDKGHTQLCHFGKEVIKQHLHQTLPPDWLDSEDPVIWFPGTSDQPTVGWLEELWLYFGRHFGHTESELGAFNGLPLIPVTGTPSNESEVQLTRIEQPSSLVLASFNGESIDKSVCQVLKSVGLTIVIHLPDYVQRFPGLVPAVANPANPRGVINAMGIKIASLNNQYDFLQKIRELPADKIRLLRTFLSSISQAVTSEEIDLLRRIPVFETFVGCGERQSHFVAINEIKLGAPAVDDLPAVSVFADLLDLRDHSSSFLAQILDTVPMSRIDLMKMLLDDALHNKYSESEVDTLVKYTLERFGIFHGEDLQCIKEKLQCLPFVVSSDNSRKKPTDLFNPEDNLLRQIFMDEDVFPKESYYSQSEVRDHLKKLGLRGQEGIAPSDILSSANKVNQIQNHSLEKAMQKSKGILTYLNKHLHVLRKRNASDESFHRQLSSIPWVPVVTMKPPTYPTSLPLKESANGSFARIKDVKSNSFINLVGSVKNLVDVQAVAFSQLSDYFNWKEKPDVSEVIMHLGNVISNYHVNEKSFFINIVKDIYEYLAKVETSVIITELQKKRISGWVWNGNGFSCPSEISIESPSINLSPYFSFLPPETKDFIKFFKECGIKEKVAEEDLLNVLKRIKEVHDRPNLSPDLCEHDLSLSITILNKLKPQNENTFSEDIIEKLFVPIDVEDNTRLELAPVMECTYCDPEWEKQGYDVSDLDDKHEATIKLIHRNIPHSTAELLGVPTLLSRFLSAEELQMGESFGQSESLLDRLRGLLEGYTDGLTVPKELIQNADDAGATEVRFLYDERTNDDCMTCLIDEGMKECQGPALWAYNDAVFSDEDFQNVVKLNAATKKEDSRKIGRFGLGFNSVYNLTDVPSFVSRNYIVILDPHTTYLGKAIRDKSKPGIKLRMEEKKLRRLANQFKPYNGIFGCDLRPEGQPKSYNGTLFRFPLRTVRQASESDIKKLHYDDKQIRELLRILFDGAESLLLFTQNVLRVTVYHLRNESTENPEPTEVFRISKSCSKMIHRLESELSLSKPVQKLAIEDQELVKQISILKASSSLMEDRLNGNFNSSPRVLMKSSMILKCQCTVSDDAKHFGLDSEKSQVSWLVTSCMVSGNALDMSLQNRGLLPTAGVAAKLTEVDSEKYAPIPITCQQSDIHYQSKSSHNGNVFCFLPLPIHSGLSVHINGCFAVSDNRRYLRERTEEDKTDQGAEWNDVLMKEVVCQAYVSLLEDLKKLSSSNGYQFHSLWPRYCDVQTNCQGMVAQFYRSLFFGLASLEDNSRMPELFSDGEKWASIQNVVFLEPAFSSDERIGQVVLDVMKKILESTNKIVVNIPEEIFQSFKRYELQSEALKRCYNKERFFREMFFPAIGSVDASSRDKLVLYSLDDDSEGLRELIRSYRCIPSSPSGCQLKYPKELLHPNGKAAQLFSPEDERFPHGEEFTCEERLVKLKRLGMRDDDLEWSEVIERAESIKSVAPYHRGLERTKLILAFIDWKLNNEEEVDQDVQATLQQVQFLPVMKKPKDFPLKWKGDEYTPNTFLSAAELYPRELKYLASASAPILDDSTSGCDLIKSHVKNVLSMDKNVSLDQVKTQLKIMIEANEAFHNSQSFGELKKAFENVYDHLQDSIKQNWQEVVDFLKPLHFILIEKQLLSCRQVVFSSRVSYPPYLSKLPFEYKHSLSKLFKAIGVRECFEMHDYVQTLRQVKDKYGENPIDEELVQVTNILNSLAEEMSMKSVSATEAVDRYGRIFIPDSKGIMKASNEVCVKDCYWMPNEPGINYINERLTPKVGSTLGANTRRQETLRKHAFGIPFGQKEKLTNRLKKILTGYPCDESILKELIQNADDAKATKICFINDPRQHPQERVFEECWKPLQGPALCVYNDAPFTKRDIEGIQNLGEGSKGDDPNKTGRYGVGFNAVYHLTDAPTFISQGDEIGEVMCVFDPNLKFAPGADPSNPGVMYDNISYLKEIFTDVFPCYLGQHFPSKNGTMFRFPLRNEEMAKESKICHTSKTTEDLAELLDSFKEEMLDVLLFVNNVKEISVCEIDKKTGGLTETYSVKALLSAEDEEKRKDFADRVNEIGKSLRSGEMSIGDIPVSQVSYVVDLEDKTGLHQKWFVVQKIGFENAKEIPEAIDKAFKDGDLGLLPRGGVASLISPSSKPPGKGFCFLPLPFETGLPVHINGHFALDHEARRQLWRNDRGDDRSVWNVSLLRRVIAPCYATLLDEVREHIFLPINGNRTNLSCSPYFAETLLNSNYASLFPSLPTHDPYWQILAKELYCYLDARSIRLLPVLRQVSNLENQETGLCIEWLPPGGNGRDHAFFGSLIKNLPEDVENLDDNEKDIAKKKSRRLRDTLLAVGFNLICMPMRIYKCFKTSKVNLSLISPKDVIQFFGTYNTTNQLCCVGNLPSHIKDTQFKSVSNLLAVLKYCKQDVIPLQKLEGLPLLLTEDEVLRVFSTSDPVFKSEYYDLIPHCSYLFLHHAILSANVYCETSQVFFSSHVFREFDIEAFAGLLPKELNEKQYKTTNRYVLWHPENESVARQIPDRKWIIRVWEFLSYHFRTGFPSKALQGREEKDQRLMSPISDWCLLPIVEETQQLLAPIGMSATVIHLEGSSEVDLKTVLEKLFLPQINCQVFDGKPTAFELARQLVADGLEDPNAVLKVLCRKLKTNPKCFESLLKQDCDTVLQYFSYRVSSLQEKCADQMKMLPIYPAIHGDYISISGKIAFVLSQKIPKDDMQIWEEKIGIAFLIESESLKKLYKFLNCDSKDKVVVYCDIIFDRFGDMSEGARLEHMKFLREMLKSLNYKSRGEKTEQLVRGLSTLKFLPSMEDGSLKMASSFYDPSNEVYKVMFENKQGMFPPKPFCEDDWLDFLRQIGMVNQISETQFEHFAKEVEIEAITSPCDETRLKSETLITYLLSPENVEIKPFRTVKDICFVFSNSLDPRLQGIHPLSLQMKGTHYTCFKGSVANQGKNQFLVWTCANLLPDNANPLNTNRKGSYIVQELEVLLHPTVEMVVTHCKNICNVLCQINAGAKDSENEVRKTSEQPSLIMKVMISIYDFLQHNYRGKEDVIKQLHEIRCIAVSNGKQFVFPKQISIDITSAQEIRPYLYKIPPDIAAFARLFENLGATTTVTSIQYANILNEMQEEFGDQNYLHPNEITKVFKATKGFFETIGKDYQEKAANIPALSLPAVMKGNTTQIYLRRSEDVFYNDAPHFKERLNGFQNLLLVKLEECGLKVGNDESLINMLPESIRPRKLTAEVHERLTLCDQTVCHYDTAALELEQLLTSSDFCLGLIRLIKHDDNALSGVETSDLANIRRQLSCIHVYGVPVLRTRLVYNDKTIPESERDVSCFEEKIKGEEQEICKIYVKAKEELKSYVSRVAQVVDRITGHKLKTMLVHLPTMLSLTPSEIKSFLDALGIYENNTFEETQATYLPTPGSFIHIADHHLLVDDFTSFSPGEYVGYELDDPSLRGEEGTPTYIYAIIIEEVNEEGQPTSAEPSLKMYRINIGKDKEPIIVDATDLYKFYRPNQTSIKCLELEIFSGSQDEKPVTVDANEVRKEVTRILEDAWALPEEKRKKIIKRLFLKWHPDKNPGNETFCTEIFKFIQQEIERLEGSKRLEEGSYGEPRPRPRPRQRTRTSSRRHRNRSSRGSSFSFFFRCWEKRASSHKEERNSYRYSSRDFFFSPDRKNPQPAEARRWFNQAVADLNAAKREKKHEPSYEWVCFKCHQSAEKALKAAQYSLDANKTNTHSITALAQELNSSTLRNLASELESVVGNSMRMRYPDQVRYPNIPHDVYDHQTATKAMKIASSIIEEVESEFLR